MAISVTFLPESELLRPLVRQILRAKRSVDMVYFYWKTRYDIPISPASPYPLLVPKPI